MGHDGPPFAMISAASFASSLRPAFVAGVAGTVAWLAAE
jgi:hypothetical protein